MDGSESGLDKLKNSEIVRKLSDKTGLSRRQVLIRGGVATAIVVILGKNIFFGEDGENAEDAEDTHPNITKDNTLESEALLRVKIDHFNNGKLLQFNHNREYLFHNDLADIIEVDGNYFLHEPDGHTHPLEDFSVSNATIITNTTREMPVEESEILLQSKINYFITGGTLQYNDNGSYFFDKDNANIIELDGRYLLHEFDGHTHPLEHFSMSNVKEVE